VKLDEKIVQLIEVKAVGLTLNDRHLKQAIDYAANQGIEWVVLTNAINWQLYHVIFGKPIDKRLVLDINITSVDPRKDDQLEMLYPLSKEGMMKGAPAALRDRQDATSRFLLAALLLYNEQVLNIVRRELRRVVDVNVSDDDILKVLQGEVIKRDAVEGPQSDEAAHRIKRGARKSLRTETPRPDVAAPATAPDAACTDPGTPFSPNAGPA